MKLKRFGSAALAAAMTASMLLAGCGRDEGTGENSGGGEMPEIVMTYITYGTEPQDLDKVEAAVSEYCEEQIQCTVKFKPVSISELSSQYTLWAASGEAVDLLLMYQMDLGSYVNDNSILCLDDYMEDAENIARCSEESLFLCGGTYSGKQYAIPSISGVSGEGKGFLVRSDLLEEIDYEEKENYTYEDLDDTMGKIKANHPEMIMVGRAGKQGATNSRYFIDCDTLGVSNGSVGVLMGKDSTEIVNLFATDEYYEFLQWQQEWYEKGFISSDAITTSDTVVDWVRAGRCAGFIPGSDAPGSVEGTAASLGYQMDQINVIPAGVTTESYNKFRWCISANSENPEKAMQVLDLMYAEDGVLSNLLMHGIEGEHYVRESEETRVCSYPEGVDASTSPYPGGVDVYGDMRNVYVMAPNTDEFYDLAAAYTEKAEENRSIALGYVFENDEYSSEIAAITNVISQYQDTLEYGMAEDLDAAYQEFLNALDDAGIEKVIEGNQEQFDAWLAEQNQ